MNEIVLVFAFITHSFNKPLLTVSFLKDVPFCSGDAEVNKKDKVSAHSLPGEVRTNKASLKQCLPLNYNKQLKQNIF